MRTHYCSSTTWTLLLILRKVGLLKHLAFTVKTRIMGTTVHVPMTQGHGLHGLHVGEPWAHHLFPPLLSAFPGTFVDVGVNLGQTLTRVRSVDRTRPYIGFEPNPLCVQYTRELARINRFDGSTIIPAGLSTADGVVDLVMINDDLTDSSASIIKDFRPGKKIHHRMPVIVVSFATAERDMGIGPLGVVKIDVEGGEREVLLSMEHRLRLDRPAISLEILPVGRAANVDRMQRQQDIEAMFQRLDYRMNRIHNKGAHTKLERMTGPIGIHDDPDLSNFVVLPAERNEELFPQLERALAQQ